jgi:hypothetical protein
MEYNLSEHKHRFSTWTAARAVQRSFAKTYVISNVIKQTGLRNFAEVGYKACTQAQYDAFQREWCSHLIDLFNTQGVAASYGQTSKLIAIYLKTSLVLQSEVSLAQKQIIHPPIDSIVLRTLPTNVEEFRKIRKLKWTIMDQASYWDLVKTVRGRFKFFDWRLEMGWSPEVSLT